MSTIRLAIALLLLSAVLLSLPVCQVAAQQAAKVPSESQVLSLKEKDLAALDATGRESLIRALRSRVQTPDQFLASRFEKHDLVFLGENHHVRDTCEFVAEVLPTLYKGGARQLATEFLRSSQTKAVQRLVNAETWDRDACIAIMRELPWPIWGFEEYLEILHAVWRLNHSLEPGQEPFRILGLDSEWDQYETWFGKMSRKQSFQERVDRENNMVTMLESHALKAGRKTLVHIGFQHSVTFHGGRAAAVLHNKYPGRLFQVVMHMKFGALKTRTVKPKKKQKKAKRYSALTEILEELVRTHGKPLAFEVLGTPVGAMHDISLSLNRMVPKVRFEQLAQGYVILVPLDRLQKATWIPGFITAEKFEQARPVAERLRWVKKGRCETAESLNAALQKHFPAKDD
jgi:hypothetical protein